MRVGIKLNPCRFALQANHYLLRVLQVWPLVRADHFELTFSFEMFVADIHRVREGAVWGVWPVRAKSAWYWKWDLETRLGARSERERCRPFLQTLGPAIGGFQARISCRMAG